MDKKVKLSISVISLTFIFLSSSVFAETIVLKSGQRIEGKILEKTDKYAKVDFQGVALTYFIDDIESIDGKPVGISKDISAASPALLEKTNAASGKTNFELNIKDERLRQTEGGVTKEDTDSVTIAFENGQTVTFSKHEINWPSKQEIDSLAGPAQEIASKALGYFIDRDHEKLYELNHSEVREKLTKEQLRDYINKAYSPSLGKPTNFTPFMSNKFYSYSHFCLTFEVDLLFENGKGVAVISITKDKKENGELRVWHFSFFPNVPDSPR